MEKLLVGSIVGTHGIKGEVRIFSQIEYPEKALFPGNKIYIDNKEYTINTYRHHKKFEMITLNGYNNINDVLPLMKKSVYIDKNSLVLSDNEVLDSDLVNYKVISNRGDIGHIIEIFMASPKNKIIRVIFDREVLVPYNEEFVRIDKEKHEVYINLIEGM